MNMLRTLWRAIRLDIHRWRNRRARARHFVETWPITDRRDTVAYFRGAVRRG